MSNALEKNPNHYSLLTIMVSHGHYGVLIFNVIHNFNTNCDFNMYEILSETIFPTCPQQNDTNVMSPNDKG